jgi:FtsP/CotA-like multicopper oxidase with cupredoxin domain
MKKPHHSSYPMAVEDLEQVTARFETVPASDSETGCDEVYVVFAGMRIAKRGNPGTPQAGTWISLEPGFQVAVNGAELVVIHDTKHASIH